MNDIEYISELFVAMMHSAQDGKKMLDQYYSQYEIDFPDEKYWRGIFTRTVDTIEEIFPDLAITRWRRKPDFYGLFSALAHSLDEYVISEDKYETLEKELLTFQKEVGKASIQTDKTNFSEPVNKFAWSVAKATSNRDRRTERESVIIELIKPFLRPRRRLIRRRTA